MSNYTPDGWIILKMPPQGKEAPWYRIAACWWGGYLGSDSWQFNSGIHNFYVDEHDCVHFTGLSGSVYSCHKNLEGRINSLLRGVIDSLNTQLKEIGSASAEMIPFDQFLNEFKR